MYQATIPSPLGNLALESDGARLTMLHFVGSAATAPDNAHPCFDHIRSLLDRYWAGEVVVFDVPMKLAGTPFQARVWNALRGIPYGETTTYGALAGQIGAPRAVRAVGRANGANPIALVVPCHRVVGSNGSLTGYGGGIERKQQLLEIEGVTMRAARAPLRRR